MSTEPPIPFGAADLDPTCRPTPGPQRAVRCYVRGCPNVLKTPTRQYRGDVCPAHGIRCHLSRGGATYGYRDPARNVIVAPGLFASRVVNSPHKYESHRLGYEKSEDALTWNVFRSLQEAGCLHQFARLVTGRDIAAEPMLFLWGMQSSGDLFAPWPLLAGARVRFESHLPVNRPHTEPDIALYLPGVYLILVEAKFTSPNTASVHGPRKDGRSLTLAELLDIYSDDELRILDLEKARAADRVYYQLWRNMVFAEWMSLHAGQGTRGYLASLTRAGQEGDSCRHFAGLIRGDFTDRFAHVAWEDINALEAVSRPPLARLRRYFQTKTAGLRPAFRVAGA